MMGTSVSLNGVANNTKIFQKVKAEFFLNFGNVFMPTCRTAAHRRLLRLEEHDSYRTAFDRLLRDLKATSNLVF